MPEQNALTRKLGPLPLWAWLALGGGVVGAWWLFLRRRGETPSSPVELVTRAAPRPQDLPSGGYPSVATPPAQMLAPEVLADIQGVFSDLSGSFAGLYSGQAEISTSLESQLDKLNELQQKVAEITLAKPSPPAPAPAPEPRPKAKPKVPVPRYYTFAPGRAPKGRKADELKLRPGQQLRYAPGRGYYAVT